MQCPHSLIRRRAAARIPPLWRGEAPRLIPNAQPETVSLGRSGDTANVLSQRVPAQLYPTDEAHGVQRHRIEGREQVPRNEAKG
jgi:hypothetical protein